MSKRDTAANNSSGPPSAPPPATAPPTAPPPATAPPTSTPAPPPASGVSTAPPSTAPPPAIDAPIDIPEPPPVATAPRALPPLDVVPLANGDPLAAERRSPRPPSAPTERRARRGALALAALVVRRVFGRRPPASAKPASDGLVRTLALAKGPRRARPTPSSSKASLEPPAQGSESGASKPGAPSWAPTLNVEPLTASSPLESPKLETPKFETPKLETPKLETPKLETPKLETPKLETPKIEAPRIAAPKKDAPKKDAPSSGQSEPTPQNTEPVKAEPVKAEPVKAEAPKPQQPTLETPPLAAPMLEPPKLEPPKLEPPKLKTPKLEPPKLETPKLERPTLATPTLASLWPVSKPRPAPTAISAKGKEAADAQEIDAKPEALDYLTALAMAPDTPTRSQRRAQEKAAARDLEQNRARPSTRAFHAPEIARGRAGSSAPAPSASDAASAPLPRRRRWALARRRRRHAPWEPQAAQINWSWLAFFFGSFTAVFGLSQFANVELGLAILVSVPIGLVIGLFWSQIVTVTVSLAIMVLTAYVVLNFF